jgi:maltose-binding protein MalE
LKHIIKKVISISLTVVLIACFTSCKETTNENVADNSNETKDVQPEIVVWYTNSDLSDYIDEAAKEYSTENNIIVTSKLVSAMDYIENINQAVLGDEIAPDLFVAENSNLEKLYLAGLTLQNTDETYSENSYYETALNAFTYKNKLLAYPMYFETSYLLYNQDYVTKAPETIDEILTFADEFDAPEGVEAIFNWDVTDILCNYFFVGNYLNNDEINNENYILDRNKLQEALTYYQNLNQYFAIDAKTVDYETAFEKFTAGKSVFTIAKTDKLPEIEMIEGETSDSIQAINQNGNTGKIYETDEEGVNEAKEDDTSKEEQEKNVNNASEKASKDNTENIESSAKEPNVTKQISQSTLKDYTAGIEKMLRQCFAQENSVSDNQSLETNSSSEDNSQIEEGSSIEEDAISGMGTIVDKNSSFKIVPLPNLTTELESKGLAISYGVFVNGYTQKAEEAKKFAKYLTYDKADKLYEEAGKLSSRNDINYNSENIANVLKQYENSANVPKQMENEDYWLKLEIAFSNIWKGEDVAQAIEEMSK